MCYIDINFYPFGAVLNAAHLHVILVHFPVIVIPLGALLLALGIWRKNLTLQVTAYYIFIGGAAIGGAAFLLGDGAEEIIEHVAGVVESAIEPHEEASELAIWFVVALGVLSIITLATKSLSPLLSSRLQLPLLALAIVTSGLLGYAAQLGGKIRHPEAFDQSIVTRESAEDRDDDD